MILFRQRGIRIALAWFDEPGPATGADIVLFLQRPEPMPGLRNREKHTLLMDLSLDSKALFSAMGAGTRNEIRRAQDKDGIRCEAPSTDEANLSEFIVFYSRFASQKGLPQLSRSYLLAAAQNGSLSLSRACDPVTGEIIVWHAHLVFADRARLFLSASLFRESKDTQRRNLIGRANRYLHWHDVLRFKDSMVRTYDWGGWYTGTTDEAKLQINRFKKEFGGTVTREWTSEVGVTWKGRLALLLRRSLGQAE